MKHKTKEELIEQLKTLSNDETEVPESMGAMCYSPAPPEHVISKCDLCGKEIEEEAWFKIKKHVLLKKVKDIQELGFDAKIEHLCYNCVCKLLISEQVKKELSEFEMYYVFYFKTKEQENYHIAISNDTDDYDAVLAFLNNEKSYTDYYDATHLIKDELDLIERMTGISIK